MKRIPKIFRSRKLKNIITLGIIIFILLSTSITFAEVKNIAINYLVTILITVGVFVVVIYYPTVLQKEILAKNIVKERPTQNGDILFSGDKLEIKGLWTIKRLNLQDLELIKGYVETTLGVEEVYCIDFVFSKPPEILFDISKPNHRKFIDNICEKLNVIKPNWDNPFIFINDKDKDFQTIYRKQN